ncbi:MAG: DNA cytosine methyltransferase [Myxococcales bacterium FL481]|nr:MAG: DNA cytosine methyltransferase [Myxococcales bacterium FL481]
MTFGSLFAGIGGFDLGLERAGMECRWQVEADEMSRSVLATHWPNVPRFPDVSTFRPGAELGVDVVCGGFPCQDISSANVVSRVGLDGARSGLVREQLRVIDALRPRWAIFENSAEWPSWVPYVRGRLARIRFASVPLELCAIYEEVARLRPFSRRDWRQDLARFVGEDDGVPGRMERLQALGRSVAPQVVEWIGRRIVKAENRARAQRSGE